MISYTKITNTVSYIANCQLIKLILYIFCISLIHWSVFLIYNQYCFSYNYFGFITNIINMGSPFCHTLNTIQFKLSDNFNVICLAFSSYLISKLIATQ